MSTLTLPIIAIFHTIIAIQPNFVWIDSFKALVCALLTVVLLIVKRNEQIIERCPFILFCLRCATVRQHSAEKSKRAYLAPETLFRNCNDTPLSWKGVHEIERFEKVGIMLRKGVMKKASGILSIYGVKGLCHKIMSKDDVVRAVRIKCRSNSVDRRLSELGCLSWLSELAVVWWLVLIRWRIAVSAVAGQVAAVYASTGNPAEDFVILPLPPNSTQMHCTAAKIKLIGQSQCCLNDVSFRDVCLCCPYNMHYTRFAI